MNGADSVGTFMKFANPTVANGKVYVPTMDSQLIVYGLLSGTPPVPAVTGLVNAASYAAGAVAPGEMIALFGQNVGPQRLVTEALNNSGRFSSQLDGTVVTFNGIPAPLVYTSSGTAAAIVPYAIASASKVTMQVTYNGRASTSQFFTVAPTAPGIFTANASGSGGGAILNAAYTLNTSTNPAAAGSIVIVYGTGGGQTTPASVDGAITTAAMPLNAPVSVTAGGQPAQVLYAGNAGGEVAGVTQFNLRLPAGVTGTVPIVIKIGAATAPATVTISIH